MCSAPNVYMFVYMLIGTHMVPLKQSWCINKKQYEFYNQNLSILFQYLCITLVIKKLYEFEISTLGDFLILFIKLNTKFLLKGGKFKTLQIRNSQEGLKWLWWWQTGKIEALFSWTDLYEANFTTSVVRYSVTLFSYNRTQWSQCCHHCS